MLKRYVEIVRWQGYRQEDQLGIISNLRRRDAGCSWVSAIDTVGMVRAWMYFEGNAKGFPGFCHPR